MGCLPLLGGRHVRPPEGAILRPHKRLAKPEGQGRRGVPECNSSGSRAPLETYPALLFE